MQDMLRAGLAAFISPENYVQEAILDAVLHSVLCVVWFYAYSNLLVLPFLNKGDNRTKRVAWVPTLLSAIVGSVAGTVQCLRVLEAQWAEEVVVGSPREWRFVTHFFMTYFVWDWILSFKYYPDQFDMLSGYVHHIFYFLVCGLLLHFRCTSPFIMCLVMEYSSCFRSIGSCHPSLRSDVAFGVSFLLVRIIFHMYVIWMLFTMNHPLWMVAVPPLLVHFFWFKNWCSGYLFGGKQKKRAPESEESNGRHKPKLQ